MRRRAPRPSRVRRIAIAALGAAIATCAATTLATRSLIAPRPSTVGPPPASLAVEHVSFPSPNGSRIAAWFVAGSPGKGAIVLMHGVGGSRAGMSRRMTWLARDGHSVLAFDFQAHGESPGPFITFGQREALDAGAAVAWLRARLPGERVGAIGASLGGAAALLGPTPLDVDALVLEAVYPEIRAAVANRLALHLGEPARVLAPLLLWSAWLMTGVDPATLRPIDRVDRVAAPILVASGLEDRHTTADETRALARRLPDGAEAPWLLPGVAHVDLHAAAPAAYETRVGAFLRRHLSAVARR